MGHGRHAFEDQVPSWMFAVRSRAGRLAVAATAALLLSLPMVLLDSPDDLRLGPALTLGLVVVAAVAGWWATAFAGIVVVVGYWWNGVPPTDSFALSSGSSWVGLLSMVVLVVGLVVLTRRVEQAVEDVRRLDELRQIESFIAERDAGQIRAAMEVSAQLSRTRTMADAARVALERIDRPAEPSSASIAIVRDGHLQVLATRNVDPAFVRGLERVDLATSTWLGEVMGGEPAFVDDREEFAEAHPDARVLYLYPSGSWLVVPFRAETTIGLLSVHFTEPQPVSEHRVYFTLLAEILANSLERGQAEERREEQVEQLQQAFAERDRIARTLSTTLLPPRLPSLPGCTAAGWLIPVMDQVAGDFYDVFPLVDGGWVAVLGDVCGKGAEAAAVSALARYAARVTALEDPDPLRIAEVANAALTADPSDLFCTMAVVRYVPDAASVDVTLAGHPKVRIVRDDGVVRAGIYGAPLGLAERPHQVERHCLGPGDRIVLFSDGLIERDPAFGEDELDRALVGMRGTAQEVATQLRERVLELDAVHPDDLAALVVARM